MGTQLNQQPVLLGRPQPARSSSQRRQRLYAPTRAVLDTLKPKQAGSNGAVKLEGDEAAIQADIKRKLDYVVAASKVDAKAAYRGTALSVREHLIDSFNKTQQYWRCACALRELSLPLRIG